jgi:hypothetical protein
MLLLHLHCSILVCDSPDCAIGILSWIDDPIAGWSLQVDKRSADR